MRGHSGDPMNELADTLARGEARAIRSSGGRKKANNRSDAKRSDGKAKNGGAAKRSDAIPSLSHVDSAGKARMVDVGAKPDTERVAEAKGSVTMSPETLRLIKEGGFEKGTSSALPVSPVSWPPSKLPTSSRSATLCP